MNYARVIPRDLFNEANLLKCYGRLALEVDLEHDGGAFDIQQDPASGALHVANVRLVVRGREVPLFRPLNSREPWPLWATTEDGCDIAGVKR